MASSRGMERPPAAPHKARPPMCGIVGILSHDRPVSAELLALATRRLFHRGPDHQEWWIAPDGQIGLGSARLSIVDLVSGDQPIANEDGTLHAVVNGEL